MFKQAMEKHTNDGFAINYQKIQTSDLQGHTCFVGGDVDPYRAWGGSDTGYSDWGSGTQCRFGNGTAKLSNCNESDKNSESACNLYGV